MVTIWRGSYFGWQIDLFRRPWLVIAPFHRLTIYRVGVL